MKYKIVYVFVLFLFFFLLKITIGFTSRNDELNTDFEEAVEPISFRISNNLSSNENTVSVDEEFTTFMEENDIVGASVAITKDEKLVYAKGFGFANRETGEVTEPKHLFRIASVSKLVTAVTVMHLQEHEQLQLSDKVFGNNGILNGAAFLDYKDKRYENITVEQLLTHTSGLPGKKGDPLFRPLNVADELGVQAPVSMTQTIEYVLSKKLKSAPGKRYSYSNIGYAILGAVIEKVTDTPYEDYVKFNILQPLGINDMHIGKNYYEQKFHNEVKYYPYSVNEKCYAYDGSDKMVSIPYGGNNIEVLGAAGGWVASAPELIKLIVAVDGFANQPDILSGESIRQMIEAKKVSKSTIGWRGSDGYGNWWRTGTLSGSSALVIRQRNNVNWVVLLNTSTKKRSHIHSVISRTMFDIVKGVEQWPEYDLFSYYNEEQNTAKPDILGMK